MLQPESTGGDEATVRKRSFVRVGLRSPPA